MKTHCYLQGSFKPGCPIEIGTLRATEFPIGKELGILLEFPPGRWRRGTGVKVKEGDQLIISWEKTHDGMAGIYTVKIRSYGDKDNLLRGR